MARPFSRESIDAEMRRLALEIQARPLDETPPRKAEVSEDESGFALQQMPMPVYDVTLTRGVEEETGTCRNWYSNPPEFTAISPSVPPCRLQYSNPPTYP